MRLEALWRQLESLKAALPKPEPWPPVDSFGVIIYDRLRADGVSLPEDRPNRNVATFLLEQITPFVWAGVPTVDMIDFEEVMNDASHN